MPAMTGICKYLDDSGAVSMVAVYDRFGKPDRVTPQQYEAMHFQPPLDQLPPCGGERREPRREPTLLTEPPDKP